MVHSKPRREFLQHLFRHSPTETLHLYIHVQMHSFAHLLSARTYSPQVILLFPDVVPGLRETSIIPYPKTHVRYIQGHSIPWAKETKKFLPLRKNINDTTCCERPVA